MRKWRMGTICAFLLGLACAGWDCSGATPSAAGSGSDVYLGYSRLGNDAFNAGAGGLNGYQLAAFFKTRPLGGIEAELAHYGLGAGAANPHSTSLMFGPKVSLGFGLARVFAHGLIGGEHSSDKAGFSGGALAWALGGGVDLPLSGLIAWRVGADYISAPTSSPGQSTRARFTTGIALRF